MKSQIEAIKIAVKNDLTVTRNYRDKLRDGGKSLTFGGKILSYHEVRSMTNMPFPTCLISIKRGSRGQFSILKDLFLKGEGGVEGIDFYDLDDAVNYFFHCCFSSQNFAYIEERLIESGKVKRHTIDFSVHKKLAAAEKELVDQKLLKSGIKLPKLASEEEAIEKIQEINNHKQNLDSLLDFISNFLKSYSTSRPKFLISTDYSIASSGCSLEDLRYLLTDEYSEVDMDFPYSYSELTSLTLKVSFPKSEALSFNIDSIIPKPSATPEVEKNHTLHQLFDETVEVPNLPGIKFIVEKSYPFNQLDETRYWEETPLQVGDILKKIGAPIPNKDSKYSQSLHLKIEDEGIDFLIKYLNDFSYKSNTIENDKLTTPGKSYFYEVIDTRKRSGTALREFLSREPMRRGQLQVTSNEIICNYLDLLVNNLEWKTKQAKNNLTKYITDLRGYDIKSIGIIINVYEINNRAVGSNLKL